MKPPRPLCAFCHTPFEQTRKDRRTCSKPCSVRLWQREHADQKRKIDIACYWRNKPAGTRFYRPRNKPGFARD